MYEQKETLYGTTLSERQQQAVAARGCDVVVTAGAGTGKTRTLVARYLSLLAEGLSPRRIVAITFTRKAAREMRNRVRRQVRQYIERADLPPGDRARWQETYTALDAARIGTIHSLCGEILRHHPAEAGVDPRFEMLDEGQAAVLQSRAVDRALAWAADDEEGVRLFGLLGENKLRGMLTDLMRQRLDAGDAFDALPAGSPEDLLAYWQAALDERRQRVLQALLNDPAFEEAVALLGTVAVANEQDRLVQQWREVMDVLNKPAPPSIEALAVLDEVRLNVGGQAAWQGGKEDKDAVKEGLRTLRELWREAADLLTLVLTDVDRSLAAHYGALRALFDRACAAYAALKQERLVLDFDDLEGRALDLVARRADVRAYWQAEIAALLVDEFQDTNGRQRALLDRLAGQQGKLFCVGDGKQSIYRFRGADVTVFRRVRDEIERQGQAVALSTSYRAHRDLIAALNATLEPVLGRCEDPNRPYIEPFARLEHAREAPASGVAPPYIELYLVQGAKRDGALERAARALVARLVALVEKEQIELEDPDPEEGAPTRRPLNYGDIAILCRASGSFPAYENALDEAGVPFLTVAGRGFYDRPEIRDLLNALRALEDPTDDLALAGLLRSPACGLSDLALYRLSQAHQRAGTGSWWETLCGDDLAFLEQEAERAAAARAMIERLYEMAGRVPVADVLKAFLDATHYGAMLLQAGQGRGARNAAKLLADANASEMVGVGAFLEYVSELRDVGTREGEAHTLSTGAVQVMSVHAAKGLEYPVVVIGDAGRRSPRPRGVLVDPELGVLPALSEERIEGGAGDVETATVQSSIYQLACQAAIDQEQAESDRLLYVAATRAQEMLLVNGVVGRGLRGWLGRLDLALGLQHGLSEIDLESDQAQSVTLDAGGAPVACHVWPAEADLPVATAAVPVPPAEAALPDRPPLLAPLVADQIEVDPDARQAALDPPQRVWRVVPRRSDPSAPAWVVGQIAHRALQHWAFPDAPGRDWYAWAASEARSCGITDQGEAGDAARRAARILVRFQHTPLYAAMQGAARRLHEVPYAIARSDGALEHGTIDALYQTGGAWTLVEFKTDRIPNQAELDKKLAAEDYVAQVGRYLDAVECTLGVRPRPVLCLLNYARTVRAIDDLW